MNFVLLNWPSWCFLLTLTTLTTTEAADDDYNIIHRDGSFQFGYNNPDSYHHAAGDRNNLVRGEFGGRNPGTGRIDSTQYTAGPRGYRPRGKNVHRKYDLNQGGPRPVGSKDDPYFDPYEDPSYSFEFKTRTYNRQENANRLGDVTGRYNYVDDVGELHNVEFIAGKNTGFHVKTPYPDSNPRAYGPLYFRGRGKPIPRGRTSIQRGLDGSYRFISAGPDQRRTETSDASGHVRGSYTYLDDKGVQHSVHYIAGPETGYRVLKNVKGPHLPTIYPFGQPEIIPPDFYDYPKEDLFDTAASGHVKPINNNVGAGTRPGTKPDKDENSSFEGSSGFGDLGKPGDASDGDLTAGGSGEGIDNGRPSSGGSSNRPSGGGGIGTPPTGGGASRPPSGGGISRPPSGRPPSSGGGSSRPPFGGGSRPPSGGDDFGEGGGDDSGGDDFEGELFGPSSSLRPKPPKPSRPSRPIGGGSIGGGGPGGAGGGIGGGLGGGLGGAGGEGADKVGQGGSAETTGGASGEGSKPTVEGPHDDGSYKPGLGDTGDDGTYIPPGDVNQDDGSYRPVPDETGLGTGGGSETPRPGGFGGSSFGTPSRPSGSRPGPSSSPDDYDDSSGLFGSESNARPPLAGGRPPVIQIQGGGSADGSCKKCSGTIVTNVGDRPFSVPPGVSVRAHVQSIDLLPLISKVPSPSEQFNEEMSIKTEQLNSAASNVISSNNTVTESSKTTTTVATTVPTTSFTFTETTTIDE